jgi:hypothetical protein
MSTKAVAATAAGVIALAGLGGGLYAAWPLTSSGPVTGTETFAGTEVLTAAQAGSQNFFPTIPLTASGLFSDKGSIYLAPGSGKNGNGGGPATIRLNNGNIRVHHGASNPNEQPVRQGTSCVYAFSDKVGYTVTGGTGRYSNVTGGHGTATVTFRFTLPKLVPVDPTSPAGCNTGSNAVPLGGSASFSAVGPVTRSS